MALRHQLITRGHDKTGNHQIGAKPYQPTFKVAFTHDLYQTKIVQNSRISDQQFQAGRFPASCRAPQSTCTKDSLPLRRLESTTMRDSDLFRCTAQMVNLEQWCILE